MDNHYNRSFNGQNLGNEFASSFQFVVPRIRDIFIRPVHTAIEFGKMNSAILGTTMILINMALKYGILQGDYSRGSIELVKKEPNSDICWS